MKCILHDELSRVSELAAAYEVDSRRPLIASGDDAARETAAAELVADDLRESDDADFIAAMEALDTERAVTINRGFAALAFAGIDERLAARIREAMELAAELAHLPVPTIRNPAA